MVAQTKMNVNKTTVDVVQVLQKSFVCSVQIVCPVGYTLIHLMKSANVTGTLNKIAEPCTKWTHNLN